MKLRWYLAPFALFWWLIIYCRNLLYDLNILKSKSFNVPTIVIGNLSTGGTGKSPHSVYLIQMLKDNYKLAILSRGYKRKTKGFQIANYDSNDRQIGDEPMMFFNRFKNRIVVSVAEKRVPAINKLLSTFDLDVILLDDAYQHRQLKASYNILLTTYSDPFSSDYILPMCNLLDPVAGRNRAQCVIVTKCPVDLEDSKKLEWRKRLGIKQNQSLFFSKIVYGNQWIGKDFIVAAEDFKTFNVVLVTGLADDTLMHNHISENTNYVKHLSYPDHYNFKPTDVQDILKAYEDLPEPKLILTSEKDYMRMNSQYAILSYLFYLPIEIEVDKPEAFKQEILNHVH